MIETNRDQLAKQYLPLIKKISRQYCGICSLDYNDIEGYAWEGLVIAMNTYNEKRSSMSFKSFASFGIRNAILNGINREGRTINISYYKQKVSRQKEEELPTSVSLEKNFDNEDHLFALGLEDDTNFDNPWEVLYKKLESNFPDEWVQGFYSVYGLNNAKVEKSKDVAKKYGVSSALITKRTKKIVSYIQQDKELSSLLRDLL